MQANASVTAFALLRCVIALSTRQIPTEDASDLYSIDRSIRERVLSAHRSGAKNPTLIFEEVMETSEKLMDDATARNSRQPATVRLQNPYILQNDRAADGIGRTLLARVQPLFRKCLCPTVKSGSRFAPDLILEDASRPDAECLRALRFGAEALRVGFPRHEHGTGSSLLFCRATLLRISLESR